MKLDVLVFQRNDISIFLPQGNSDTHKPLDIVIELFSISLCLKNKVLIKPDSQALQTLLFLSTVSIKFGVIDWVEESNPEVALSNVGHLIVHLGVFRKFFEG